MSCKAFDVKKLDKCGKKYRNVLSVSKKTVPLQSQFRGMALSMAHEMSQNYWKEHI